jgi:hypothetical protein
LQARRCIEWEHGKANDGATQTRLSCGKRRLPSRMTRV